MIENRPSRAGKGSGRPSASTMNAELVLTTIRSLMLSHPELLAGPLADLTGLDDARRTEYLRTLRAFFDAAGDVGKAGTALYVHPNTVRYRLRRLREIYGLDLADPQQRLVAELQLRLMQADGQRDGSRPPPT